MADLPGYTTTYFPGTATPGDAQRLAVDVAQEVTSVDFMLANAPTARIAGTVSDAEGRPVTGRLILTPSRRSGVLATEAMSARIDADGRFEFPNLAPGEYVIQSSKTPDNSYTEGESVSQFVTVNGSDVTGLALRLSRGSTVAGHLTFDGDALADLWSALTLQAVPVDSDRTVQSFENPASARIQPDGTFELAGLSGPRVLRLTEAPRGWMLQAVTVNGRDVTDEALSFGRTDESIDSMTIVLTNRVSTVTGHVLDARRRGVSGATVVMFSTDREQWSEQSRFLAISSSTEGDGGFSVGKLAPGDHYAAAMMSLSPGEWHDPDVLEMLVPRATHVTLSEGETVTTDLQVISR